MKQLSYHFYGNYFAQALLATAAHARDAAGHFASYANPDIVRAANSTFSALVRQLQGEAADMAQHPQAGFVLELLLERCNLDELARVAAELGAAFVDTLQHKWGNKLLQRLVARMVRMHACCVPARRPCGVRAVPTPDVRILHSRAGRGGSGMFLIELGRVIDRGL